MRNLVSILLLTALAAPAGALSQGDRNRALSELHATRKMFLDALANLSEAQLHWKPAPDRWSVAECAEHIILTEDFLFEQLTDKILKTPAAPEKATAEQRAKDEEVLKGYADRSQKAQAPDFLKPTGKWKTREALIEAFKKSRDRTIAFVRETNEDLRAHFTEAPGGRTLDAYQWILFMVAHSNRHIQQIREVKSSPGFPAE